MPFIIQPIRSHDRSDDEGKKYEVKERTKGRRKSRMVPLSLASHLSISISLSFRCLQTAGESTKKMSQQPHTLTNNVCGNKSNRRRTSHVSASLLSLRSCRPVTQETIKKKNSCLQENSFVPFVYFIFLLSFACFCALPCVLAFGRLFGVVSDFRLLRSALN